MKRLALLGTILLISGLSFTSCRENTERKTEVREVEIQKETPDTIEREGALERAAKKVDKEINKEIDEEIEEIGDDN